LFYFFFIVSSSSTSTGYSSGSSIDGGSTILSAFSSRSNSSLSERSKTSPTSFKPIVPIKYQITTDEDFNAKSAVGNQQEQASLEKSPTKRRKISISEV
jgi:hypothetical protein